MMHLSSTVQNVHLQPSRCSPLHPKVGSQGPQSSMEWRARFVFEDERENEAEREKERKVHPFMSLSSNHSTPLTPGCCSSEW